MSATFRRRKKGQVEFIIVIILIAIGVTTVSYAIFSTNPDVLSGTQETKTVKDSVVNFISEAGYETLEFVSLHGGYASTQEHYVLDVPKNNIQTVNYYYYQGENLFPTQEEIESNIAEGVTNYINVYKKAIEEDLKNQGVVFGELKSVDAKLFDNKIILTVNLPTTVDNQTIQQPYQVDLVTKFGEIYNFGKEITALNADDKFFETYTWARIISTSSEGKSDSPIITASSVGCEPVYVGWNSMRDRIENVLKYVVSHTYLPERVKKPGPGYTLPPINGNNYDDLQITLSYPTGFRLSEDTFQFITVPDNNVNQIAVEPTPSAYSTDICTRDSVVVNYFIRYPVVVTVVDDITRSSFRFAFEVVMKDYGLESESNSPNIVYADFVSGTDIEYNKICQDMKCSVRIPIVSFSSKEPISHASVTFAGCSLGQTDENGILLALAPCAMGELRVVKEGYQTLTHIKSIDSLENSGRIFLTEMARINIIIHEVPVTIDGGDYSISTDILLPTGKAAEIQFHNSELNPYETILNTPMSQKTLPQGGYSISGVIRKSDGSEIYGQFAGFPKSIADGDTLHVYIPTYDEFDELVLEEQVDETKRLNNLLKMPDCGLSGTPVHNEEVHVKECTHAKEELD